MSRDYAPRGGGSRRPARKNRSRNSGVPGWIWLIAGLSFGLTVAAFVYIRQPAPALNGPADGGTPTRSDDDGDKPRRADKKPPALSLPPKEKERFTFYEILKNQEVVLPNDAVKSSKPPSTPAPSNPATPAGAAAGNTGSYIIQVASFRSQSEAEKQKAGLALLGVESRIESVTIDGKNTFYRVRIGPDSNWSHVQATMSRLESSGIQALLVKVN
ncbi:MAG TPA: SPOR domain-containing protein [Solimonas sp.]|nr:SPOR domain-containing protein [Solimonas sp.]